MTQVRPVSGVRQGSRNGEEGRINWYMWSSLADTTTWKTSACHGQLAKQSSC